MRTPRQTAEAFSSHRFEEAYPHLADDVRWVAMGQAILEGRDAVIAACTETATELVSTTTEFLRFVTVEDVSGRRVAVDVVARYRGPDGATSLVSSCDIYEFSHDRLVGVTSYAVELDADAAEEQWVEAGA